MIDVPDSPEAFSTTLTDKIYNLGYYIYSRVTKNGVQKYKATVNGHAVTVYKIEPNKLKEYGRKLDIPKEVINKAIESGTPLHYIKNIPGIKIVSSSSYVEKNQNTR